MTRSRLLSMMLMVLAAACRDSAPRSVAPPAASPSAAPAYGGLRPLTSRDAAPGVASDLPPGHPPIGGTSAAAPAGATVAGRVSLASALGSRSGVALFIIARNQAGQIVAVRKEERPGLPLAFSISAADAMTEGTSFEGRLDLTARLSQTGDAIPAKGDLEGMAKGVLAGAQDVAIVLDSVRQ